MHAMLWHLAQSGGGGASNYVQLIVWALLISTSVIGWLVRLIAQKREEARVRLERRRQEEELLRTGRGDEIAPARPAMTAAAAPGPASHDEARRRLQEIAQRRRIELQQMAGPASSAPPVGPRPPTAPIAPASRPFQPRPDMRPRPEAPVRSKPTQKQEQRQKQKPQQGRPQQQPRPSTLAEKLMEQPAAPGGAYAVAPQPPAPAVPTGPSAAVPRRGVSVVVGRATSADGVESLRKALALAEILSPPVSMRTADDSNVDVPLLRRAG